MTARCLWLVYQSFEWRWCFIAAMFKVQQSYGSHLLFCILQESWENRKDAGFPCSWQIGWIYLTWCNIIYIIHIMFILALGLQVLAKSYAIYIFFCVRNVLDRLLGVDRHGAAFKNHSFTWNEESEKLRQLLAGWWMTPIVYFRISTIRTGISWPPYEPNNMKQPDAFFLHCSIVKPCSWFGQVVSFLSV